jgi:4-hydroxybenzoate polyprenyltransferase
MLHYLKLVRWPNLLITILTMVLVRYYLILPLLAGEGLTLQTPLWVFICLVLSVVLIAAGGYVINDYFDVRIDNFNHPEEVILGVSVPIKHAIPFHATLSIAGIILGLIASFAVGNPTLVFVHLLAGLLLWLYSARYKRKPVWGNMVVAVVSALVVAVVWLFEVFAMFKHSVVIINRSELNWTHMSILFFAIFAFLLSLIREMIKDAEDIEGDRRYGCRTLPVVVGMIPVKWIVIALTAIGMVALGWVQIHLWGISYNLTTYYFMVIQFMMGFLIYKMWLAQEKSDYTALSQLARIIMVGGILALQIYHLDQS